MTYLIPRTGPSVGIAPVEQSAPPPLSVAESGDAVLVGAPGRQAILWALTSSQDARLVSVRMMCIVSQFDTVALTLAARLASRAAASGLDRSV